MSTDILAWPQTVRILVAGQQLSIANNFHWLNYIIYLCIHFWKKYKLNRYSKRGILRHITTRDMLFNTSNFMDLAPNCNCPVFHTETANQCRRPVFFLVQSHWIGHCPWKINFEKSSRRERFGTKPSKDRPTPSEETFCHESYVRSQRFTFEASSGICFLELF